MSAGATQASEGKAERPDIHISLTEKNIIPASCLLKTCVTCDVPRTSVDNMETQPMDLNIVIPELSEEEMNLARVKENHRPMHP